jgi:hypothetical protein
MKKRTTNPTTAESAVVPDHAATVADHARQILATDARIETRRQQLAAARASLEGERADQRAAQETRDRLRLAALADGEPQAQGEYLAACVASRSHDDRASEAALLIGQLEVELRRLEAERTVLVHQHAHATMDWIGHEKVLPAAVRVDKALEAARAALHDLKTAKAEQLQVALAADLPALTGTQKRFNMDHVDKVIRWKFDGYGVTGIRQHWAREMTLAEMEAARQGFAPATDDPSDDAEPVTPPDDVAARIEAAMADAGLLTTH